MFRKRFSLLLILIITFFLAGSSFALAREVIFDVKPIFTAGEITLSDCYPCHINLDRKVNKDPKFFHSTHIERGAVCSSCHPRYPHRGDKTEMVSAESCLVCHFVYDRQGNKRVSNCLTCHNQKIAVQKPPSSHFQFTASQNILFQSYFEPSKTKAKKITEIEVSLPITMADCYPCHINLDATLKTNPRFLHLTHLERGAVCAQCHQEFPHKGEKTKAIPATGCLNCHFKYTPFGKYISGCSLCHPPAYLNKEAPYSHLFNPPASPLSSLQPASLIKGSLLEPSEEKKIELPFKIKLSDVVSLSDCLPCHQNIDNQKPAGIIFSHWPHFKQGFSCYSCHLKNPHAEGGVKRVEMGVCSSCHSARHGAQGKIASDKCSLCHSRVYRYQKPDYHTPSFNKKLHGQVAKADLDACSSCHPQWTCESCHLRKDVVPPDHQDRLRWRKEHGRDNYALSSCYACHSQTRFCNRCHRVVMPHPVAWLGLHKKEGKNFGYICRSCHREELSKLESSCQQCHHLKVTSGLLDKKGCSKCHPPFTKKLAELFYSRGLMVHRAHFDMTQTEPFECFECHGRTYAKGEGCFSFELCKECHGKRRLGKLVARYEVDNGELCSRCHLSGAPTRRLIFTP